MMCSSLKKYIYIISCFVDVQLRRDAYFEVVTDVFLRSGGGTLAGDEQSIVLQLVKKK